MAAPSRDQAFSLLSASNNHGDLAVKLSSLKQVKDILSSVEPSHAAELFPYLVDFRLSPEILVRRMLVEIIEDVGLKALEYSAVLMPVLLALVRDGDSVVARKSIICGTKFFCSILEEMKMQFVQCGDVERWLEELWMWMLKFKDIVVAVAVAVALEPISPGTKLLALKFLETYILLFTPDTTDYEKATYQGGVRFNVSCLHGGHPILDPVALTSEANKTLGLLLNLLLSASRQLGSSTLMVVRCLSAVARKRKIHYNLILSALLDLNPNSEEFRCHLASIQYALRTAFLGFLRCTGPPFVESREILIKTLQTMNAGDAADQVIRQVEKMIKNSERVSREARQGRDDQPSSHPHVLGDMLRKRCMPQDNEDPANNNEVAPKRSRYGPNAPQSLQVQINNYCHDSVLPDEGRPKVPLIDSDLNPVEKMIGVIGELLAEGERGAESLELLISNIHPDLLSDIVITNMRHLPKSPPPLTRLGSLPISRKIILPSVQTPVLTGQVPFSSSINSSLSETPAVSTFSTDSKRDPRRDPRRLDPIRAIMASEVPSMPIVEDTGAIHFESGGSGFFNDPVSVPATVSVETAILPSMPKEENMDNLHGNTSSTETDLVNIKEECVIKTEDVVLIPEVKTSSDQALSPPLMADKDYFASRLSSCEMKYEDDTSSFMESDLHSPQHSPTVSNTSILEETCLDLPLLPHYIDMTDEQQISVRKLAVKHIIKSHEHLEGTNFRKTWMALLARLVAQLDAGDDVVLMLRKHMAMDHQQHKGHEVVLYVLYHLHSLVISDSVEISSSAGIAYEMFFMEVAKCLLDALPASDKSFSRLLAEVPVLPDPAFELLDNLCNSNSFDFQGSEVSDGERVTQGLGAVWALILCRPNYRQSCLSIALKCAAHTQDEIRAKAIRLVSNKLYQLSYISNNIEQHASNQLLSAVDEHTLGRQPSRSGMNAKIAENKGENPETATTEIDDISGEQPGLQSVSTISFSEAQSLISLYFALCTKKPSLLQLVFDAYGRAPKNVKQAFHFHMPILLRAMSPPYSELLHVLSDPPEGSENLLALVLQVLTQETTPSADLIVTLKHLYATKLKDVSLLIPILSSLSKDEVLPIFPRLIDLPIEKFQTALAHILQGSAHTGPALTPAEVLVAIHDIGPEKDGLSLKKITDACSTCFEQKTVFTQQVLAKALNRMVDQTPLPLLFMRTVIQAIDAFPALVDVVMEILSKLVSRQVWRMPKLWVGFLKCVSQTQPHSFHVLLQLPSPQLESALNKHTKLRGSLAAYANQPSRKASLPRSTLAVLGLANESHPHQPSMHPSEITSTPSVHGATMT